MTATAAAAASGRMKKVPVATASWPPSASNSGPAFIEVFLDGLLVGSSSGIDTIVPGHQSAYIKTGIYRNGDNAPGHSELLVDSAKLGTTAASISPTG